MFKQGVLLALLLLLSGCGQSNFNGKVDDTRSYWVYSQIDAEGGYRTLYQSEALQQYRVTDTSPLTMDVALQQFDFDYADKMTLDSFNGEASEQYLLSLFSQGLTLTQTDDDHAAELTAHASAAWQQLQQQAPPLLLQTLQKNLLMPTLLQALPTELGQQVVLTQLAGVPLTLTVTAIDPQRLTAKLSAADNGPQLAGELVLDRRSGWLERLVLVMDVPVVAADKLGDRDHVHLRLALLPEHEPFDWLQLASQFLDAPLPIFSASEHPEELQAPPAAQALDIGWAQQFQAPTLLDRKSAIQYVLPFGWQKLAQAQHLHYVEADVDYYPTQVQSQTVTWQAGEQQFSVDGVTIHITPDTAKDGLYNVEITTPSNKKLLPFYNGLRGEVTAFGQLDDDSWWRPKDQLLLNKVMTPQRWLAQWQLSHQPEQVTFYVATVASEAAASRHMRFIPRDDFMQDPLNPPHLSVDTPTKAAGTWQQVPRLEGIKAKVDLLDVPAEWAQLCEPKVVKTDKQFAVHWQAVAAPADDAHVGIKRYQLVSSNSADAWRGQMEVTSRLECRATPKWHALTYQPSDASWLVPVTALPKLDLQQPVSQFLLKYRFINPQQALLPLLGPDGRPLALTSKTPLAQVLTAGKQLRFSDAVAQILVLRTEDKTAQYQWHQPLLLK
ncbi:hypothetical protein L9G15_19135 [Shewanella sp. A3A]|nr:hypothetical protein [Shewanella ferrihydritica]